MPLLIFTRLFVPLGLIALIEDCYLGKYDTIADYARELTESCEKIPHGIEYYIDYESMSKDMLLDDLFTLETDYNEIHVFQLI